MPIIYALCPIEYIEWLLIIIISLHSFSFRLNHVIIMTLLMHVALARLPTSPCLYNLACLLACHAGPDRPWGGMHAPDPWVLKRAPRRQCRGLLARIWGRLLIMRHRPLSAFAANLNSLSCKYCRDIYSAVCYTSMANSPQLGNLPNSMILCIDCLEFRPILHRATAGLPSSTEFSIFSLS